MDELQKNYARLIDMKTDVVTVEQSNVVPMAPNNPTRLIELAIEKGADVDQLEKLMALQERWEANQARKSFFASLAEFQSIVPAIRKRKQGHNYNYAPLGDIAEQIRKPLQACGLSYRFEQDHAEAISVTCVVTHVDGHSERTSMQGLPDTTGSKNAIQATGSTVSYLQRYSLIGSLGITTADDDIDARLPSTASEPIGEDQIADLESLFTEVGGDKPKFLAYFKINSLSDLPEDQFKTAIKMLERKRK